MKLIVILFFLLGLLFQSQLWFGKASILAWWQLSNKVEQQLAKNNHLEKTNLFLAHEIKEMQANNIIIETIARSELGLIKKGEQFYQFFD